MLASAFEKGSNSSRLYEEKARHTAVLLLDKKSNENLNMPPAADDVPDLCHFELLVVVRFEKCFMRPPPIFPALSPIILVESTQKTALKDISLSPIIFVMVLVSLFNVAFLLMGWR